MRKFPIFFSLFMLAGGCGKDNPRQEPVEKQVQAAKPSVPSFDGKRAFQYLVAQTDFGPRTPGSAAHTNCLAYLKSEMEKHAYAVNIQNFTHPAYKGGTLQLSNIIASFNPEAKTRILLLAHWDSRPRADQDPDPKKRSEPVPGANDGASGVAVLLEIARNLKAQPPACGVDILLDDGEDYGMEGENSNYLLGTKYFAKNLPPGFRPAYGILLDMIGDRQLEIPKERYSLRYAPDIVELVWSTARELGTFAFSNEIQGEVIDDHLPLNEAGIKTIDLIDFNYPDATNRYWHTTQDTPDKCSPESLESVGSVLLHVIYAQPA